MEGGFIKIYRQIEDSVVWQDENPQALKVWLYCLMRANYTESKIKRGASEYIIKPGEFLYSRDTWAKKLGLKKSTLRNIIERLRFWDMLEDIQKDSGLPTIYKIRNWEKYQQEDSLKDSLKDSKRTATGQLQDTSKNDKNNKNVKNNPIPTLSQGKGGEHELLKYWELTVGTKLHAKQEENIKAAEELKESLGQQGFADLIMSVRMLHAGSNSPLKLKGSVFNFISLKANLDQMLLFGRGLLDGAAVEKAAERKVFVYKPKVKPV